MMLDPLPEPSPQISVILCTNRASPYLPKALQSLSAQTYRNWELVVVDDGSPDPEALAAHVSAISNASIRHQQNQGLAIARNAACFAAQGTHITFLDDDDYWPVDRLAKQVAAVAADPSSIGCYGTFIYVDPDDVELGSGPDCSTPAARLAGVFHIGTLLFKRSVLTQAGSFNPLLPPGDDLDFILRLVQVGALAYIPDTLLFYRRHPASITTDVAKAAHIAGVIYECYYQLALSRGDRETASAITAQCQSWGIYVGKQAARAAKHELGRGDLGSGKRELREATLMAKVVARSLWRRTFTRGAGAPR